VRIMANTLYLFLAFLFLMLMFSNRLRKLPNSLNIVFVTRRSALVLSLADANISRRARFVHTTAMPVRPPH